VEVQGLRQPLHSGLSGPVPDPVQILCAMIASLRKPSGALNVPGLYAKVARPSATHLARIHKLPMSETKFTMLKEHPGARWGSGERGKRGAASGDAYLNVVGVTGASVVTQFCWPSDSKARSPAMPICGLSRGINRSSDHTLF